MQLTLQLLERHPLNAVSRAALVQWHGADNITTTGTVTGGTVNATATYKPTVRTLDSTGNLINIGNITGTGAVTVTKYWWRNALTLNSGSGTVYLTYNERRNAFTTDVNNGAVQAPLSITNSGAGVASLGVEGGATPGQTPASLPGGGITGNPHHRWYAYWSYWSYQFKHHCRLVVFDGSGLVQSTGGVLSGGAVNDRNGWLYEMRLAP